MKNKHKNTEENKLLRKLATPPTTTSRQGYAFSTANSKYKGAVENVKLIPPTTET